MQDTLESNQIAFVDTVDEEITTVIEQASSLQRYEYVIGTVDDVWTSPENHHFDLIQYNETTEKINQIHCVIFNARRSSITTDIIEVRQLAVASTVSFHPLGGYGSILVEEVASLDEDNGSHPVAALRMDRRIQLALATVLLLAVLAVGALLVIWK